MKALINRRELNIGALTASRSARDSEASGARAARRR